MSKFVSTKRVDLSHLPSWVGCYIDLNDISVGQTRLIMATIANSEDGSAEQIDLLVALIQDNFISGKGWDGEKVVDMTKEDVVDLPMTVLNLCFSFLGKESSLSGGTKPEKVE